MRTLPSGPGEETLYRRALFGIQTIEINRQINNTSKAMAGSQGSVGGNQLARFGDGEQSVPDRQPARCVIVDPDSVCSRDLTAVYAEQLTKLDKSRRNLFRFAQ